MLWGRMTLFQGGIHLLLSASRQNKEEGISPSHLSLYGWLYVSVSAFPSAGQEVCLLRRLSPPTPGRVWLSRQFGLGYWDARVYSLPAEPTTLLECAPPVSSALRVLVIPCCLSGNQSCEPLQQVSFLHRETIL